MAPRHLHAYLEIHWRKRVDLNVIDDVLYARRGGGQRHRRVAIGVIVRMSAQRDHAVLNMQDDGVEDTTLAFAAIGKPRSQFLFNRGVGDIARHLDVVADSPALLSPYGQCDPRLPCSRTGEPFQRASPCHCRPPSLARSCTGNHPSFAFQGRVGSLFAARAAGVQTSSVPVRTIASSASRKYLTGIVMVVLPPVFAAPAGQRLLWRQGCSIASRISVPPL